MSTWLPIQATLLAAVLATGLVGQTVIHVPADQPTIQQAVDQALPGDTIAIGVGVFTEPTVQVPGFPLTIRGAAPTGSTVIAPPPGFSAFLFEGTAPGLVTLRDVAIQGVTAATSPVVARQANVVLLRCTIEQCTINGKGGALTVEAFDDDAQITVQSCTIRNCSASIGGGAINVESLPGPHHATVALASTVVYECTSDLGPALVSANAGGGALVILQNATVYGNVSLAGSALVHGVVENTGALNFHVLNTICWANGPTQLFDSSGSQPYGIIHSSVGYSDIEGGVLSGNGNLDADPRFVSPWEGDFRLQPDSPCLDVGGWYGSLYFWDVEGEPRLYGPTFDIGADEMTPYRRLQGSGEGLALQTYVYSSGGPNYPAVAVADLLHVVAWGDDEAVDSFPIAIVAQVAPRGGLPGSPDGYPEVHVNPWVSPEPFWLVAPGAPESWPNLPGSVVEYFGQLPDDLLGCDLVIQALIETPDAENGFFVASDALLFEIS